MPFIFSKSSLFILAACPKTEIKIIFCTYNSWLEILFKDLLKSISPNPNIVPRNKTGKKSFNNRFQQFLSIANCIQLWIGKHTYFIIAKMLNS